MKTTTLQLRTVIPPLIIILIGGFVFGRWSTDRIIDSQTNLIADQFSTETRLLSELAAATWEDIDLDSAARDWSEQGEKDILFLSPEGTILGSSRETNLPSPQFRPEIQEAKETGVGVYIDRTAQSGIPVVYTAQEIIINGQTVGFVHITHEMTELSNLQRQLLTTWILAISGIFGVVALVLFLTTNVDQRRLVDISIAIQQIAEGDFNFQLNPGPRDEIGSLATSVNQLSAKIASQIQELETEQSQITAALEQMNEGVMILNQQGQVVLANPYALKFFDISEKDTIGKSFIRVIQNHQITELWQDFYETRQEQAAVAELTDMNKLIQVSLTPLEETLQDYSLIVFQDLTQIRQLQTIRRDFISNISHELRTPLASLKALAETLQISALDDPEAARRFLNRMDIEIEALAQMVSELLELTRIESGQVPLELERIDANVVLNNAVERISVQAERADVSLKAKLAPEPEYIIADPIRMEQVLVNIIHNAIKFTPENGKVRCKIVPSKDVVTIEIRDNGMGIPQEDLPRIFERFYKSKRPKQGAGTGLGLSIAKHLVEVHGGKIWAESQLEKGTQIYISLPKH
jgi:two-component system phosphate regulon sensor histidine kinase PhoR